MLPPHSGSTKSCIWAVLATLRRFGIVLDPEEVVQINPWCAEDDFSRSHYLAHIHQLVYYFQSCTTSRLKSSLVVQTSTSLYLGALYMIMVNYL